MSHPRCAAIVPTVGSADIEGCLRALHVQLPRPHLVVVAQGAVDPARLTLADCVLSHPQPLGFARAVNLGLAATDSEYVAVVNDDAVVEAGWTRLLLEELERDRAAAAAQGVNCAPGKQSRIDGWGIGWNEHWQAVQMGHGRPATDAPAVAPPVFGVSATAAIYRRAALEQVRLADGIFDEKIETFYEDVDLAARLRAAGHEALAVASARCLHLGGVTTARSPARRWTLLTGNRRLVLRRLLGSRYSKALPTIDRRDRRDFVHAILRGDRARCRGLLAGRRRDRELAGFFSHSGAALLAPALLESFGAPPC